MKKSTGRHELKHYITISDYYQLRQRISAFASADTHAQNDNTYFIRSLYFDNYNEKALKEKIDGVNRREKFRLRFYNQNPDFIRLEKKSKENGLCYKISAPITKEEVSRLLDGEKEVLKENGHPLLLELYTKMHYQQLTPKHIVDYRREAYVFSAGNVRVTIDDEIRSAISVFEFLESDAVTIPIPVPKILEIKYDNFLPEIIRGLLTLSSRQSSAFSKYAASRIPLLGGFYDISRYF